MKNIPILTLLISLLSSPTHSRSYNEVKDVVFQAPRATLPDPDIPGIEPWAVLNALIRDVGAIVGRSDATFKDTDDFREGTPKLLHPRGVCTEGVWNITESSPATGLFSKGTKVPAIVRFSSGTADSEYLPKGAGRILGLAVKVFPTIDKSKDVITENIQMLDSYGFERSNRKRFFHDDDGTPVTFTNVAPAKSILGKVLSRFFDRFDKPNHVRPVYPMAEVNTSGEYNRDNSRAPYEITFKAAFPMSSQFSSDFRNDIMNLPNKQKLALDIFIVTMEPESKDGDLIPVNKKIGQLLLGDRVISDGCDYTLHFNHIFNDKDKVNR